MKYYKVDSEGKSYLYILRPERADEFGKLTGVDINKCIDMSEIVLELDKDQNIKLIKGNLSKEFL